MMKGKWNCLISKTGWEKVKFGSCHLYERIVYWKFCQMKQGDVSLKTMCGTKNKKRRF